MEMSKHVGSLFLLFMSTMTHGKKFLIKKSSAIDLLVALDAFV